MEKNPGRRLKYTEVGLEVPLSIHEIVCNYIIENFAGGLILQEEEDSDLVGLKFYIAEIDEPNVRKLLTGYINALGTELSFSEKNINTKKVPDVEWIKAYRDSIAPVYVDNLVIHPPWIQIENRNLIDIIIEPKMAFGTGYHESTVLSIKAILKYLEVGDSFFDLGCGSGILSILAAKKNAVRISGADIDPQAVENARENVVLNGVADRIKIESGSIEIAEAQAPYDFVVVNIIKKTIMDLYDRIDGCTREAGKIVLSGLLSDDENDISRMLVKRGRQNFEIIREGDWLAYTVFK